MVKCEFYVMRHGQTAWNAEGRFQGLSDIALSHEGRSQVCRNARRLRVHFQAAGIDCRSLAYFTSTLRRARQTMELVHDELGIAGSRIKTDTRLDEASFGRWEGLTSAEVKARFPQERRRRKDDRWNFAALGGASHASLSVGMISFLEALPGGETVMIVTHNGNMRVALGHLLHLDPDAMMKLEIAHDAIFRWRDGVLGRI